MTVTVMEVAGSVADGALGDGDDDDDENSRRCWDPGGWLIDERRRLDVREAAWLLTLAQFDRDQGWAVDGHLSCVAWLQFHTHMARATAFEKLQVAHQLRRRPTLAEALRSGRISYSAARLIARMDHPDPEVDEAVIDLAAGESLRDVERVVRRYHEYRDQDQPPVDHETSRGVRVRGLGDGTTRVEITVTDLEAAELVATLDAFTPAARPADRSEWGARRADGWMDMARCALANARHGGAAGDDRYLVHLVVRDGQMTSVDGSPVPRAAAATVCCDAATVVHHQDGGGSRSLSAGERGSGPRPSGGRRWSVMEAVVGSPGATTPGSTSTTCTGGRRVVRPIWPTVCRCVVATTPSSTTTAMTLSSPVMPTTGWSSGTGTAQSSARLAPSRWPVPWLGDGQGPVIERGSRYVALGSSFAAGPGLAPGQNYPSLVAEALGLALTDVSQSGARTVHVLDEAKDGAPPQIEAVSGDTRLVTVTIGGNDLGYVGGLMASSLRGSASRPLRMVAGGLAERIAGAGVTASADHVELLTAALTRIASQAAERAPAARVVLVDYLTLIGPAARRSPTLPLTSAAIEGARATAAGLRRAFVDAATTAGADLVTVSTPSLDHGIGTADPWVTGFRVLPRRGRAAPFHPNAVGMRAVADRVIEAVAS